MEPKFKNTFIPKRSVTSEGNNVASNTKGRKMSFMSMLGTILFVLVLIAAAGMFGYTQFLQANIADSKIRLQEVVDSLQEERIRELAIADAQLDLAHTMLREHLVPSRFFSHLEEKTLQNIQFTQFSYEASPGSSPVITMSGIAPNYETIALQSDVFSDDVDITDSLFSGLREEEEGPNIIFDVDMILSRSLTSYKN